MTHDGSSETTTSTSRGTGAHSGDVLPPTHEALSFSGELLRKGLHLLALCIPLGMYVVGRRWALLLLIPLALLAVCADIARAHSSSFARVITFVFGRMMRPNELPRTGRPAVINGATWVLVSACLLALLFPMDLAAPAFAAFMVADAAAAIVGLRLGRHRWPGTKRTVEGSVTFAVVAAACLLPFGHIGVSATAIAALSGAAAEAPAWRLNDNVRVPLVMATVLLLFSI